MCQVTDFNGILLVKPHHGTIRACSPPLGSHITRPERTRTLIIRQPLEPTQESTGDAGQRVTERCGLDVGGHNPSGVSRMTIKKLPITAYIMTAPPFIARRNLSSDVFCTPEDSYIGQLNGLRSLRHFKSPSSFSSEPLEARVGLRGVRFSITRS